MDVCLIITARYSDKKDIINHMKSCIVNLLCSEDNFFVISDKEKSSDGNVIYYDNDTLRKENFRNLGDADGYYPIMGWDKAMYFLKDKNFRFAYILEDDVFIRSQNVIKHLMTQMNPKADLICKREATPKERPYWKFWGRTYNYFKENVLGCFCVFLRISKDLYTECIRYLEMKKRFIFLEVFFSHVAIETDMKIQLLPFEYLRSNRINMFLDRIPKNELVHPVKNNKEYLKHIIG